MIIAASASRSRLGMQVGHSSLTRCAPCARPLSVYAPNNSPFCDQLHSFSKLLSTLPRHLHRFPPLSLTYKLGLWDSLEFVFQLTVNQRAAACHSQSASSASGTKANMASTRYVRYIVFAFIVSVSHLETFLCAGLTPCSA